MKLKSLVLLAVAAICGLVAMLGVRKALNKSDQPAVDTVSVLVSVGDLSAGTPLDETNTEFKAVPKESVPEDVITERTQYTDRVLKIRAMPGDFVTMSKLSEPGDVGLSPQIPPGMRVVTVPVSQTTSHSGMLLPGNRVDVMLTYQARTERGSVERTRTVLQYIEIFAVDKLIEGAKTRIEESNARNVSVLVTPEQAHLLLLAGKKGDIHLALRSNADTEVVDDLGIEATELDGNGELAEFGRKSKRESLQELFGLQNGPDPEDPESVEAFLQEESRPEAEPKPVVQAATQVVATPEPPANTWKMTIYSGNEATTHEIQEAKTEDTSVTPATQNADTGKGQQFWRGLIGTYFRGV